MNSHRAVVGNTKSTAVSGKLLLVPEENLRTGLDDFRSEHADPTSLETDMLTVASAIYACDLAFKRGEREEITRSIILEIPVVNYHAFKNVNSDLELLLWTLSHDNWTLKFIHASGLPEAKRTWPQDKGATILFSGGVDSFAGAIDLLTRRGREAVQLASQVTANPVTHHSQDELVSHLLSRFGPIGRLTVRSGGRKRGKYTFPSDADREETQRTRSFVYLTIAALAARRTGHSELVVIAENGQMAIHLPLSAARIGAFSTHTAHPEFVTQATGLFNSIFDFSFRVTNPYLYKTKAEVVATIPPEDTKALVQTVSCWRGSRVSSFNHCGDCIPCIVRRIAFEHNGIVLPEYRRDLFNEDVTALQESDDGKRNLVELAEFAEVFRSNNDATLELLFPDLISTEIDKTAAINMYRRFATEAITVLSRYVGPAKLFLRRAGPASNPPRGKASPR